MLAPPPNGLFWLRCRHYTCPSWQFQPISARLR